MRYLKICDGLFPMMGVLFLALAWSGCSEQEEAEMLTAGPLQLCSSIDSFSDEEPSTRVNLEGDAFVDGDRMRLKVICPFVNSTEIGENNWNAFDAFWLNKWNGSDWTNLTSSDGCDVNGDGKWSGSSNIQGSYLVQATPYVFTASTWSQEVSFQVGGKTILQYVPVFHADQSAARNYRESDLLWAQTVMQTAPVEVRLRFQHVMCALHITLDGFTSLAGDTVLTLEGMPDIDGAEVVVGDYYAAKSKVNSSNFGYQQKHSCEKAQNGKVLGIGVNDFESKKAYTMPMTGNPTATASTLTVPNTGVYRALHDGAGNFQLIVPPCVLAEKPVVWIRSGEKRWKSILELTEFIQGTRYNVKVVLQAPPAEPDPGTDPGTDPGEENN